MNRIYIILLLCALLVSCKTAKVTEQVHDSIYVTHVKTDTLYKSKVDSVYVKDSTFLMVRNDTVYLSKWHTAYKYKTDTLYKYRDRLDTTYVTREIIKETKQTKSFLDGVWDGFAWLGILFVMLFVLYNLKAKLFS